MKGIALSVLCVAALLLFGRAPVAVQCDPNEECHKCMVSNPFGGCILYGNDPECEIRKAACQRGIPVPPPPTIPNPVDQLSACIRDPQHCPEHIIRANPIAVGQPIVRGYIDDLRRQAGGRWRSLPDEFIGEFASQYPQINLARVRYANNIDTKHGQSMTLCYEVFLAETFDDSERSSLQHMLHELYHTVQCVNRGGVGPFVDEYLLHGAGTIVQTGRLDVHDDIDHERDAESRARSIIGAFGWPFEIENSCPATIRLLVRLKDTSGNWVTHGWYTFDGGERAQLISDGRYLHSDNAYWYYYAMEVDGSREWAGDHEISFGNKTYQTRQVYEQEPGENMGRRLTCQP
jgi:hypothetical protein